MTTVPTSPDFVPDLPPEPPQWPKVVGVLSIVWGSLGLFCGTCGMAVPFALPALLPAEMTKDGLPPTMQVNPALMLLQGVSMLMSVLLIVAGVMTIRRVGAGRSLHLVFAILQFPMVAVGLYVQWKLNGEMKQWVLNNPDNPMAKQQAQSGDMGMIIGMAMGLVLGIAYPIFLLIWFGLVKKTERSMQEAVSAAG